MFCSSSRHTETNRCHPGDGHSQGENVPGEKSHWKVTPIPLFPGWTQRWVGRGQWKSASLVQMKAWQWVMTISSGRAWNRSLQEGSCWNSTQSGHENTETRGSRCLWLKHDLTLAGAKDVSHDPTPTHCYPGSQAHPIVDVDLPYVPIQRISQAKKFLELVSLISIKGTRKYNRNMGDCSVFFSCASGKLMVYCLTI